MADANQEEFQGAASPESASPGYEHGRRALPRWRDTRLDWQGWRWGRPFIGGFVGFAIVVVFLAIRGGTPTEPIDELTGTQRGGWNRLEDVHLLIVANGAIGMGLAVGLLAEYVRHWVGIVVIGTLGAALLAIREIGEVGDTASDTLLGLVIFSAALAGAVMLYDAWRYRRRAGY
ncbi:MAG: hypothetical protein V3V06_00850 [Dehalococcoidia bacterium]